MENLVNKLKNETQGLKEMYLEKTSIFLVAEFDRLSKFVEKYRKGEIKKTSEASKTYWRLPSEVHRGLKDEFIAREMKKAETHYENSILKLASRIIKKGLNTEKIEMNTSYIDVNISTTITDGEKTIRAFTIIAGGMVQRPHYRYLIK